MKIKIIAAIGKNRELGINENEKFSLLNWKLPGDLERFKKLTENQIVVMGRKTWDSLPSKFKPLSNRLNVILTRDKKNIYEKISDENVFFINSKSELDIILKSDEFKDKDLWIIGGGEIYKLFLEDANELYITEVDGIFPEANVFFPEFDNKKFTIISEEDGDKKNDGHSHKFKYKIFKK